MTTKEQILQEIEKLSPYDAYIRGRCDMWDAINSNDRKEMLADIEQILRNLEKAKSMTKPNTWIPVSERYPTDTSKRYLVCYEDGCITIEDLYFDGDGNPFFSEMELGVIAWMPLPEPFEGNTK